MISLFFIIQANVYLNFHCAWLIQIFIFATFWFNLTILYWYVLCFQVPTFSYPRFVQLLQLNCYSRSVLCGLVISIGGLQDFLRKASLSALLDYLQGTLNGERIMRECTLSDDILWVLQQHRKCDRVIIPTLKVISVSIRKFDNACDSAFVVSWHACCSNFIYSLLLRNEL